MKKIELFKCFNIRMIVSLTFIFVSCTGTTEDKKNEQGTASASAKTISKPSSSYNDTLVINTPSAVFYNPDSIQLEKIRSVNRNMVFESMVHDCFYQMRNARIVMKKYWPGIKIIETSKARFLLFVKSNKSSTCIDLNSKNDMCGIFLFNTKKDPELIDMMNVDTALEYYFRD